MIRHGWWGAQLNPEFVEWMMGVAEGWVTGCPGLSRNDQLALLGNGVVPLQAAQGIASCLDNLAVALAALETAAAKEMTPVG
jgi:DNA (cytosine-5)-methyltransferase 1